MDKRILFPLIAVLGLAVMLAPAGSFVTLIMMAAIWALFFYAIRTARRIYQTRYEDEEEDHIDGNNWEPEPRQMVKANTQTTREQSVLTQTEEEIWSQLTQEMVDIPKVEDINYENFDPPIPLTWSTLNPFRKTKKQK